jgi:hypothetical protein
MLVPLTGGKYSLLNFKSWSEKKSVVIHIQILLDKYQVYLDLDLYLNYLFNYILYDSVILLA